MDASNRASSTVQAPPTWFVSTPHGVLEYLQDGPIVRPYGVQHGRQPESGLTACGTFAVGWRIYWESPFTADNKRACGDCVAALSRVSED